MLLDLYSTINKEGFPKRTLVKSILTSPYQRSKLVKTMEVLEVFNATGDMPEVEPIASIGSRWTEQTNRGEMFV